MITIRAGSTIAIISAAIGASVWLTADKHSTSQITSMATVAIQSHQREWIAFFYDPKLTEDAGKTSLSVCVDSSETLDFDQLESSLNGSFMRPVPLERCRTERVESDDPMFAWFQYWYDEQGERALHLRISNLQCDTERHCLVDTDDWHLGETQTLQRKDGVWSVTNVNRYRITG